jgi:hypothetical protein
VAEDAEHSRLGVDVGGGGKVAGALVDLFKRSAELSTQDGCAFEDDGNCHFGIVHRGEHHMHLQRDGSGSGLNGRRVELVVVERVSPVTRILLRPTSSGIGVFLGGL